MSREAQDYRVTCRYKSRHVRRHSAVTSGSRLALPQSNLDWSTMHKWSNDPRAVHKLVTYSVTMLSGTLGAIPLRVPRDLHVPSSLSTQPLSVPSFVSRSMEMYRAVTYPPLNPSEWAVPPWRTYRTNFAPSPRCSAFPKGDENGIYAHARTYACTHMYICSVSSLFLSLSRCSFLDLFITLHREVLVPFGYSSWTASRILRWTARKRGTVWWRIILMIVLEYPIFV